MRALSSSWACDTSPVDDSERLNVNRVLQLFTPNLFPAAVIRHRKLRSFLDLSQHHQIFFMCTDPLATTAASRLATEEPSKGCSCATVWLRNLVRSITWKLLLWRDLLVVPLSCEPHTLSLSLCDDDLPPALVALNNSL